MEIQISKTDNSKLKYIDFDHIPFGKYTSDGGLGSLSVEGTSGANAKVTVSQLERLNNGLFF